MPLRVVFDGDTAEGFATPRRNSAKAWKNMGLDISTANSPFDMGDPTYNEGLSAFESGDYDLAISLFQRCLVNTDDPRLQRLSKGYITASHAHIGENALRNEKFAVAEAAYAKAIQLAPTYPDYHLGGARALWEMGESEAHEQELLEALKLNPEFVEAILAHAAFLCETGDAATGMARFEEACRRDPELYAGPEWNIHRRLKDGDIEGLAREIRAIRAPISARANRLAKTARNHERHNRLALAEEFYLQALDLAPNYADVRCKYGLLLARIQRTYEGIVHLKRAVEINPRYVEALSHLGTLLVQAGFESEGSEYIARALEIDPVYPLARRQAALAPVRRSLR